MSFGLSLLVLWSQLSAGAIVAQAKQLDAAIGELEARATLTIRSGDEVKERRFDLAMKRDGVNYWALITIREPRAMAGTKFLIRAERGKRNRQWAYFPDLDLVRPIAGTDQDDPFLGSDITYADLAGGAHLDDLRHRLIGEEMLDGVACYVMEGLPRHRIAYAKLRGWLRKDDFVTVKALFYDESGEPLKEARLSEIEELSPRVRLAHRIEVRHLREDRSSLLTLSDVRVNHGLPDERFDREQLSRPKEP